MIWNKKTAAIALLSVLCAAVNSCSVSMGFAPISSIDYNKVKTISITEFQNRAEYVYAPMAPTFNQALKDLFTRQTKLKQVSANADLEIDGEITGYNQYNESVDASGMASKVKVTMTVNVRYVNNTNHNEDFEKAFTASQLFEATQLLTEVQDELINLMVKDITEQIFNSTVANW
ncbi:MAG: LPS assembly lipoprotein LptE [Prevotellaceae bacterium]|jgi:hypothetical protein|nr:LPS assembly lipoprotein LptE [Prevotellaceae bacterium]